MLSRKNISGFMAMLMFVMQLLLAQHYTVHFQEELGQSASHVTGVPQTGHDAPDHDGGQHDKICQICVLSKSLSHLVLFALAAILFGVISISCFQAVSTSLPLKNRVAVYLARGPPAFLS